MSKSRPTLEQTLASLRSVIREAQAELKLQIATNCFGPHMPTYQDDGNSPWCAACGRYNDGRRVIG